MKGATMQHPDFKGHKVYCGCNASWAKDIRERELELERDYDFPLLGDCHDCGLVPWYYLNDQKPSPDSLNETVEANAKSLGAKEPVGATWPQVGKPTDKPTSPFLTSLTIAQRQQLYANLIAFKTFASKAFGGVAVRCSVVTIPKRSAVGFRAYRNGVPTELPNILFDYDSDMQCYPFLQDTTTEKPMIWK
jgi:hypothetical protein